MKKICFNDGWRVIETGLSDDPFAGLSEGKPVMLPHDAMISKERNPDMLGGSAQGYYPDGDYQYEKIFTYDNNGNDRCFIEFGGAYNNAQVYVNGNYAGGCRYGYTDFLIDITEYLISGTNFIQVSTRAGIGRNSRWYTGNGLYRNVFIYTGGKTGFLPDELRIRTISIPETNTAAAVISMEGKLYGTDETDYLRAEYEIRLECENSAETEKGYIEVRPDGTFEGEICIKNARLWTAETPDMYRAMFRLMRGDRILDEDEVSFGIRTVKVQVGEGLLINGTSVKLRGGCIHSDNGIVGAAEYDFLAERKIGILKDAGFNAVRISHHPASKEMLNACDRLGMYVMEESFDTWNVPKTQYDYTMWFAENWKADLDNLIRKDFNHPSVIMYTIGNEIKELDTAQGTEQNRIMYEYVKKKDPTRPVSNAINGMFTAMKHMPEIMREILKDDTKEAADGVSGDINQVMSFLDSNMDEIMRHRYVTEMLDPICNNLDVAGYNYMGGRYDGDAAQYPDRIIVGSETRPDSIASNWEKVLGHPNVIGDFVWTAWDYIGEAGIGRIDHDDINGPMYGKYPWVLSCTGDIDILGKRKPQSYYREIVWGLRKDPYIAVGRLPEYGTPAHSSNWSWTDVVRSWTWNGYEGQQIHVEIYSDAEEIELFLNGVSVGKAQVGENNSYMAEFEIPYKNGELKAVAYTNGYVTGEDTVRTVDGTIMLHADTEISKLAGDMGDLILVNLTVGDEYKNINYARNHNVKLIVNGSAELLGFGSAAPRTEEAYVEASGTTFEGKMQAVLRRSNSDDTESTITFLSEGLKPVTITI